MLDDQLESANKNAKLLESQSLLLYDEIKQTGRVDLLPILKSTLRRAYICGQDVIFDGLAESDESGRNLFECISDTDPSLGIPLLSDFQVT